MRGFAAAVIAVGIIIFQGAAFAKSVNPDANSRQDILIGATPAVQATAADGAGVTVGVIDTGLQSAWTGFEHVDTADASCLIFACASSLALNDDNGHGTFIAGEIAGSLPQKGLTGVAPAATLLPVKVLDQNEQGYGADVASGIVYAADHGATVLNISIGPSGSPQERAGFYQGIASAVNYAATKGDVIVFAGGNDAVAALGTLQVSGFTDAALQRMMFVGATSASMGKTSFTNTPGTGGFVSNTGQFYALSKMWVMADGQNITGAGIAYDPITHAYDSTAVMSGTSMAAPQAAGAAALLAARWPYLVAQGTIAQILETSTKDLGARGPDATYGDGFLRVDLAMKPIGTLTTPTGGTTGASGSTGGTAHGGRGARMMDVSGSTIVAGGAFGNLGGLSKALAHVYAFDSFGRDFPLSGSVSVTSKNARASLSPATRKVLGDTASGQRQVVSLDGGNWLEFSGAPPSAASNIMFTQSDPGQYRHPDWTYAFSEGDTYLGGGHGDGAAMLLNDARWGRDNAFFGTDAGVSGSLMGLVPDADFTMAARNLGNGSRFSFGYARSSASGYFDGLDDSQSAQGAFMAYTFSPIKRLKMSVTASGLSEKNMLLGSQSAGALALGSANSTSFGLGANYDLGKGFSLGFDAAYAVTSPSGAQNSLIGNMSRLDSRAVGFALAKSDISRKGDKLGIEVSRPLRVYAGSATLTGATGTDGFGNPVITSQRLGLTPGGTETDFSVLYSLPLDETTTGSLILSGRQNADDVQGQHDVAAVIRLKHNF